MASSFKSWKSISSSIKAWAESRIEEANKQVKEDAEKLQQRIKAEIRGAANAETSRSSAIDARTNVSSEAKQQQLSPSSNKNQTNPSAGLDTYVDAIIIESEGSGSDVVQVVKIDSPQKKDETTGMSLVNIAKAIEFGTTKSAPRPAWRRSLKGITATGVYKKSLKTDS